jgi:hypothetical protein
MLSQSAIDIYCGTDIGSIGGRFQKINKGHFFILPKCSLNDFPKVLFFGRNPKHPSLKVPKSFWFDFSIFENCNIFGREVQRNDWGV